MRTPLKCPACQGVRLVSGSLQAPFLAMKFVPEGSNFLTRRFPVHPFLCADCGNIGFRVPYEHLERLKIPADAGLALSR